MHPTPPQKTTSPFIVSATMEQGNATAYNITICSLCLKYNVNQRFEISGKLRWHASMCKKSRHWWPKKEIHEFSTFIWHSAGGRRADTKPYITAYNIHYTRFLNILCVKLHAKQCTILTPPWYVYFS